jgi:hypothetical protein
MPRTLITARSEYETEPECVTDIYEALVSLPFQMLSWVMKHGYLCRSHLLVAALVGCEVAE